MDLVRRATGWLVGVTMVAGSLIGLTSTPAMASEAGSVIAAVNAARAAHGLAPVSYSSELSSVAQSWSQHMASTSLLQHNPNLTTDISNWQWLGENV
ncbi:MAG: hypothetical protein QOE01_1565, partial [Actinomycetota bacterium]|nr:hypothetical protein [Actinomycetota bacterium]